MNIKEIKILWKAKKFELALAKLEKLLKRYKECPYLWNLRGDLIQLLDVKDGPPLAEAARSYKVALKFKPGDFDALEGLAHFYDAVEPNSKSAKYYASQYIRNAGLSLVEMKKIMLESNDK